LFANAELPPPDSWYNQLKENVHRDLIRVLEHHFKPPNIWLFLLSTQPIVRPPQIIKSVKGRLQNLLQGSHPKAFRRNFSLTSIGDARREVVEAYVSDQLGHHRMADVCVQTQFTEFQLTFPDVDLSKPQFSSHGRYVYNLHLVLVHQDRWCEVDRGRLEVTRDMIINAAGKKRHRLSRVSLFAEHVHMTLGCRYDESPEDVALGYLNNLAYAHGMKEAYRYGYYVGTFGEYDMGAVWGTLP
jgi:REP element-mobilizing transposase RayT